jgi:soluble lytic murein transglycosylase-like protein
LKKRALLLLSAVLSAVAVSQSQAAEPVTSFTVLSPADVQLYEDIFAAEKAGHNAKADSLAADLSDKSLWGYVLEERYLGPHYHAKFPELRAWLQEYGDLDGADKVYKLALKRAPGKGAVPAPIRPHWRGVNDDPSAFDDPGLQRPSAQRFAAELRNFERQDRPEAAESLWKRAVAQHRFSQADLDRLGISVATGYLAELKDKQALSVCDRIIAKSGIGAQQCHWIAGLASYRLGNFGDAAEHFENVLNTSRVPRTYSAAAFWAARSYMHTDHPERVLTLYERAASEPDSFYGLLALRLLGRNMGAGFADPAVDSVSFAQLMEDKAAHRAVALWQVGRTEAIEGELSRAFGDISPDLDPAFAALARNLGLPALELRAAETAAPMLRLSSLYPVPPYKPEGGYSLDQAMILAFARQESRFQTGAKSKAGARGVMQIMPKTAVTITHDRSLAGRNKERLNDPVYSLTLAQDYLRDLLERQNGNLFSIAAAYNAGEHNLERWQAAYGTDPDPLLFIETIPLAETRDYIKRVVTNFWMYRLRLGEPVTALDETASGGWPIYHTAVEQTSGH